MVWAGLMLAADKLIQLNAIRCVQMCYRCLYITSAPVNIENSPNGMLDEPVKVLSGWRRSGVVWFETLSELYTVVVKVTRRPL